MQQVQHIDMKAAAKILGTGTTRLNKMLRDHGVFHRAGELKNTPRTQYIERGLFTVVLGIYVRHDTTQFYTKALATPAGLSYMRELIDEVEQRNRPRDRQDQSLVHPKRHRPQDKQGGIPERDHLLSLVGIAETRHADTRSV